LSDVGCRSSLAFVRTRTVAGWARREAVLVTSLGIGAAAAGLGRVLGIRWLVIAGGVVALVGAILRTIIALRRSQLEEAGEQVALEMRFRVPIRAATEIDPTEIGIDPAAQTILRGGRIPEYVSRCVRPLTPL
jgi:hypothetical protein